MNLMQHLPDYYVNNQTMETLQGLLSVHINKLAEDFNNTLNQCFVNTATELLSRYEKIYGLTVDVTKNHEFRRERIRAKIRGTGTVTKQMIAQVARSYSNGEVEVIENNEESSFLVRFVGTKGIPANITDLRLTIEEIKPAHLRFEFEYTYNTWKDVGRMTWGEATELTWGEIRER
ncbi:hypothetical protein acsn021_01670 [Anaerocolumna cellulosilytica]|uniref:Uncharacterized protein n=1 Tax=Anaerocolumna cellulosilytica TaxID=433286 RepID=A0A6S6R0T5_9FIRM|nr:putative phage tail protein [Anaerocolumna cellulosilytica]MBB5197929.1 uncharacterized protein YmfQ (DUF2313 family) [Anaerocolumna cellulosilytica]BCJ92598.1 hypothetical protein acsn021_01670 [Anaerocolumna cellulosilytica]